MNDILVVTDQGDTVAISTMDADPAKVPGVLVDDSVTVTCIGEKVGGNRILKATELVVTAHSPYYYIQGKWVEPNPINADEVQGFELKQDGTASSINMATLAFQQWNLENGELLLKSQSIGNGQTIEGTDTLRIDKLNADSLVLSPRRQCAVAPGKTEIEIRSYPKNRGESSAGIFRFSRSALPLPLRKNRKPIGKFLANKLR